MAKEFISIGYKKIPLPLSKDLDALSREYLSESIVHGITEYDSLRISNIQNYNPIYNEIFDLSPKNYNSIGLNHSLQVTLTDSTNTDSSMIPISQTFIKYSPLLDPFRFLTGKYTIDESLRLLPALPSMDNKSHPKLMDPNNASYIDNFFCYLCSQMKNVHKFKNAIDYYGSFLGIQEKFRMNIADDLDYLRNSEFFIENKGVLFEVDPFGEDPFANFGSRKNKNPLVLHDTNEEIDLSIEDLDSTPEVQVKGGDGNSEIEQIYENDDQDKESSNDSDENYTSDDESDENDNDSEDCDDSEDSSEDESEDDSSEEDSSEDESEDDSSEDKNSSSEDENTESDENNSHEDESEDDDALFAYIKDFPIQMISLEPCKGTFDSILSSGEINEDEMSAALMQIIMILITLQKAFHFTHNDLHTNNIMYIDTDEPFLYYKFQENVYRVPTYGKIFKIIDFGRAIYKYQGRTYCSDSFGPDGDAHTQYNFEPYFNEKKARLEPNYSFDLCRLGCSIYDFILEDTIDPDEELDELQETVLRWCSDDNGKNVLYKKSGEERYPNFKLYRMIAKTVHGHTPIEQLEYPFFEQYLEDGEVEEEAEIFDIDAIPCYA